MTQHPYADILNHPRHISLTRKHLTNLERAAQYLPYAALTGYDEVVTEQIRRTDSQNQLDENEMEILDRKLQYLRDHLDERPQVTITYFLPDKRKDGGSYQVQPGVVKKVDEFEGVIVLEDATVIPILNIAAIDSPKIL